MAKKNLAREGLLFPSLKLKIDNLEKRKEYLNEIIEINDMLSSRTEQKQ